MTMNRASKADRTHEQISAVIGENHAAGRQSLHGLQSSEIAAYNRRLMFGENDEAFPSQEEWSRIVD